MQPKLIAGMFLLLLSLPCKAADEQAYLVLTSAGGANSQGKPITRGMMIPVTAMLALPPGSSVTALGKSGKIIVNGAFEGNIASLALPAAKPSDPPFQLLTSLLTRVLFFVERGDSGDAGDLWEIRPDTLGIKCMVVGQPPTFHVTKDLIGRTATIVNSALDAFVQQALTSGSVAWPSTLPISFGTEYRVSIDGSGKDVVWKLKLLDGDRRADEKTLQSMAESSCNEQLNSYALNLPPTLVVSTERKP
jgi:hypothetical protein